MQVKLECEPCACALGTVVPATHVYIMAGVASMAIDKLKSLPTPAIPFCPLHLPTFTRWAGKVISMPPEGALRLMDILP